MPEIELQRLTIPMQTQAYVYEDEDEYEEVFTVYVTAEHIIDKQNDPVLSMSIMALVNERESLKKEAEREEASGSSVSAGAIRNRVTEYDVIIEDQRTKRLQIVNDFVKRTHAKCVTCDNINIIKQLLEKGIAHVR